MGRDRYQEGRVVLVGKHIKKWRGHFYVYEKQTDGSEVRRHRNIPLGLKSEMDRGEAKAKLREIIARETKDAAPVPVNVTLRWFYENRFLPQKEQQWKVTSRPKTKRFIENYLLKRFGDTLLGELDKFTLQTYLNEMAPRFSKSVLSKIRVYFNSILNEAVELEMLPKNPAGKLAVPKSGKRRATRHLTPEEIPQILSDSPNASADVLYVHGADHQRQGRAGPPAAHECQDHVGALHQIRARERPCCRRIVGSVVEEEAERFRNAGKLNPNLIECGHWSHLRGSSQVQERPRTETRGTRQKDR